MTHKPLLARDICNKYVNEDDETSWPESVEEKRLLARALYGKRLIGKFDAWLSDAVDYLDNPNPSQPFSRKNLAYRKDKYFRDGLAALRGLVVLDAGGTNAPPNGESP